MAGSPWVHAGSSIGGSKSAKRKAAKKRKRSDLENDEGEESFSRPNESPLIPVTLPQPGRRFLTSQDAGFHRHLQQHYRGFVHLPAKQLSPPDFHLYAKAALERLRDMNFYQYDVVTAGGKHSSRTFVKRCLVGEPGITYKYLGLRLFSHSWGPVDAPPALRAIHDLNQQMIEMTKHQAAAAAAATGGSNIHQPIDVGNCQYNLTLINYMEPTSHTSVGFKEEADFGMGKVSVSWHADSSLEANSSIGVYHCLPTQRAARWDWRIALRPAPGPAKDTNNNSNNKEVLPVVVDTKDGDAYFLLGKMNETHQHAVLAGSQANRISSTHRVAVTSEDTYDYVLKRVKIARKRFRGQMEDLAPFDMDAKVLRYCQRVLTEVETEWIAQYWLQGYQHDKMHGWWQKPMKTLEAYWGALEELTFRLFHLCVDERSSSENAVLPVVLKVLLSEFKTRHSLRQKWDERRANKIYQKRIMPEYRPVARPFFDSDCNTTKLPKDLSEAIELLSRRLAGINEKDGATKQKSVKAIGRNDDIIVIPKQSTEVMSNAKDGLDSKATSANRSSELHDNSKGIARSVNTKSKKKKKCKKKG